MKTSITKILFLAILSLSGLQYTFAQSAPFQWPIPGAKAGDGIIGRPQQYIDGELNSGDMFVAAPEGTEVFCPVDGIVSHFSAVYRESLVMMTGFHSVKNTFDEMILDTRNNEYAKDIDNKYISGSISITLDDGRHLYITGLTGNIHFKTGQRIAKGEIIGKVGYAFKAFSEPHIMLSLSTQNATVDDVMTPFGLRTTFKPWSGPKEFLSEDEAEEDISVLLDAFRECYPSLYDVVTDEQLTGFQFKSAEKCKGGISYNDFYLIVRSAISAELVHDSHIGMRTENPFRDSRHWNSNLKVLSYEGKLFVGQVQNGYEDLLMKVVASIDGEPADSIVSRMCGMCSLFDVRNESICGEALLKASNWVYNFDYSKKRTSKIVFTDGTQFIDDWFPADQASYTPAANQNKPYWSRYVRSIQEPVCFARLNDSTAYFALGTFELNQVQIEEIEDSIKILASVPNMVVDMRNNPGGNINVMEKLISFFLEKPTVPLNSYKMVNSNSKYASFAHSANHGPDEIMFPEYVAIEGRDGFYDYSESGKTISPDSLVHYPGHLYILTDETSISAASEYSAYLVRNNRAITVGRETGSGYHYMTADKFVDILLPNSTIQVTIPLIREVFDEVVTERTPAGRGLMPDYKVPITYEEIYTSDNDPILDKALELIATGNCQPVYIFQDGDTPAKSNNVLYIVLAALLALASLCILVANKHKSNPV